MGELEESLKENKRLNEEILRIKKGGAVAMGNQVKEVKRSLGFFLEGQALETVSHVLEMVGEKVETKEQLREFTGALADMRNTLDKAVQSSTDVASILSNVEAKQNKLNNAFMRYLEKNESAVDGVLAYLKDWS